MKLIKISDNILVNPDCISSVEQKLVGDRMVIMVYVEDRSYYLDTDLNGFMRELYDTSDKQQYFAG